MKRWTVVILWFITMGSLNGCSKQYLIEDEQGNVLGTPDQKYHVLSFLFDGVPPPEKKGAVSRKQLEEGKASEDLTQRSATSHGPYAARLCNGCHLRDGSNRLILPVEELCMNCHELNIKKKHVHGPVAAGGCRVCHEPHVSAYRYMLVSEPKKFCFYCHNEKDVMKRDVHMDNEMVCTGCHNAHASDNDFLLK